jgi:adenylosuccinate synthase
MVKEAVLINGIAELAIMKLDVLDGLKTVKICTAYKYKGKLLKEMPYDLEAFKKLKAVYQEVPGWPESINQIRRYKDLPLQARNYLARLEDLLGVKIRVISVGSARSETIFLD